MSPEVREALLDTLRVHLRACPAGYTEHELLRTLRAAHCPGLPDGRLGDPLVLFRSHWSLFHGLYELRDRLLSQGEGYLRVEPLRIHLAPYIPGEVGLVDHDPVREIYRDLTPLETTTPGEVVALIGGFHARLRAARHYHGALRTLELTPPADLASVRRQYRRLAMRHHPDRGGEAARFTALREAREILERYFGTPDGDI